MSGALFPAWRPDAAGRDHLAVLAARLAAARPPDAPGIRLRRPDQWHATLCFIGEGDRGLVTPTLHQALADIAATIPPHAITIGRITSWSSAVVAIVHPCPALQALCDATHDAALRCGIRPRERTTQPHVTLAYKDTRQARPLSWLDGIDCDGPPLAVDGFELLHSGAGRYDCLGRWSLAGAALPAAPGQPALF